MLEIILNVYIKGTDVVNVYNDYVGPWFLVPNFRHLIKATKGTWSSLTVFQDKHLLLLLLFEDTVLVYDLICTCVYIVGELYRKTVETFSTLTFSSALGVHPCMSAYIDTKTVEKFE